MTKEVISDEVAFFLWNAFGLCAIRGERFAQRALYSSIKAMSVFFSGKVFFPESGSCEVLNPRILCVRAPMESSRWISSG